MGYLKAKHDAIYGKVTLERAFCKDCGSMTFIFEGVKSCCDEFYEGDKSNEKEVMVQGKISRRPLLKKEKIEILERQKGRCFYCEIKFGDLYWYGRGRRMYQAKLHWDHIIPYVYTNGLQQDYVAACNVCNSIKHSMVFDNIEDLRRYILKKRYNRRIGIL